MKKWIAGVVVLVVMLAARPAAAHGLGAECRLAGEKVQVEAFYTDDTPAADAAVTVRDSAGQTVAEGRTDGQGRWAFPRPAAGAYTVVIDAGGGHRKQTALAIPAADTATAAIPGCPDCCCCAAEPPGTLVSAGPTRQEQTRFPWLKAGIGCGLLGAVGVGFWLARHRVRLSGKDTDENA
jgi:nickel transport protein